MADRIKVYHGKRKWCLGIKKRQRRVEIHGGWVQFRKDLQLEVGDICLFRKRQNSRRFDVQIFGKGL